MKNKLFIRLALPIFSFFTISIAQTVISIGEAHKATDEGSYLVALSMKNSQPIAGLQLDLNDTFGAISIDSLHTSQRTDDFSVYHHQKRVLLYHPQGKPIASGEGQILTIYFHMAFPISEIDSIYCVTNPILASQTGERIWPVTVNNGSIQPQLVAQLEDRNTSKTMQTILYANHPNPFNESTTLQYDLAEDGRVIIQVFAVDGRQVVCLFDGWQAAGHHTIDFDARHLASGLYFYRLSTEKFIGIGKMVLLH